MSVIGPPLNWPERSAAFLEALAGRRDRIDARGVVGIFAHPDDETIALGAQLPRLQGVKLVHVTDGAPENMADARAVGMASREEYAEARRRELEAAMALAGLGAADLLSLGITDQATPRRLPSAARRLADIFRECAAHTVIAHAYEGGHPDHDAVAFAVHAACNLLSAGGHAAPGILEAPLYHSRDGKFVMQEFVAANGADSPEIVFALTETQLNAKRRMLDAHVTQQRLLASFSGTLERIRIAPRYDFGELPNGGELHYERMDWGLTGTEWLALVDQACAELGAPRCL